MCEERKQFALTNITSNTCSVIVVHFFLFETEKKKIDLVDLILFILAVGRGGKGNSVEVLGNLRTFLFFS